MTERRVGVDEAFIAGRSDMVGAEKDIPLKGGAGGTSSPSKRRPVYKNGCPVSGSKNATNRKHLWESENSGT